MPRAAGRSAPKGVAESAEKTQANPRAAKTAVKHRQTGEIHVTVVAHAGQRVSGAKVHLHEVVHHKKHHAAVAAKHKSHRGHRRSGRTAVTNASGQATFAHVGAGHYRATAHKKGVGRGSAHVSLKPGESKFVTIRLHERGKRKQGAAQLARARAGAAQLGKTGRRAHAPVAPHSAS
jgi:hypothetical protein